MNPHDSVGDAARIFLVAQEFSHYRDELEARIKDYLALCECNKKAEPGDDLFTGTPATEAL